MNAPTPPRTLTKRARTVSPATSGGDGRLASLLERAEGLVPNALEVDAEAIHDLRVTLRRVRVLCRELSHVRTRGPHPLAELRAGATALFRALGGLRDLDILESELEELVRDGRLAGPLAPEVGEWIGLERKRLRSGLLAAAAFFRQELERFRAAGRQDLTSSAPPARAPRRRLRKRARRLLKAIEEARHDGSVQALHKARIRGKELRYALESSSSRHAPSADGRIEDGDVPAAELLESGLKKLQDALGSVQDAAMVAARLTSLAETGALPPAVGAPLRSAAVALCSRRRERFLAILDGGRYANLLREVREVAAKQGEGKSSADKDAAVGQDAREVPLDTIPGIGAAKARHLAEAGLSTPEALRAVSLEELAAVKTIGPHQARLIKAFVNAAADGRGTSADNGAEGGEPDGKRFERIQAVLGISAVVTDYAQTLAEELSRHEEGDAIRAGRQAERLIDELTALSERVVEIPTKKLKGLRGELRETEGLLVKVLDLDVASLKMNKLRKALKAHRKAIAGYGT